MAGKMLEGMDKRLETSIRSRSAELYATVIDGVPAPKAAPMDPEPAVETPKPHSA